jgi:hypothetical protein
MGAVCIFSLMQRGGGGSIDEAEGFVSQQSLRALLCKSLRDLMEPPHLHR